MAIEFIKQSLNRQDAEADSNNLRIAVYPDKENSCFRYGFGFDRIKANDEKFNIDGISLLVNKEQIELLEEAKLDFVEMDNGEMNLIVMNPNDPSYVPPIKGKTKKR